MKSLSVIFFSLCVGVFLSMSVIPDAEAKRLGGGKSFGSKTFQQKPAKKNSSAAPSKAQQQNTAAKQAMAKKGGMMGMLGALMIGGLLGALFFGGAFENINFMDILLIGGIAFLIYKLLASRRRPQAATANGAPLETDNYNEQAQFREAPQEFGSASQEEPENVLQTGKIPRGFDSKSFLTGAENVYHLLQKAWDNKELGDLREFCTDNVFAELQDQIKASSSENRTEVVSLKAELVNVIKGDNTTEATVVFNAELREFDLASGAEPEVTHIEEAWYFLRPNNRQEHVWLLDAIQQLEK